MCLLIRLLTLPVPCPTTSWTCSCWQFSTDSLADWTRSKAVFRHTSNGRPIRSLGSRRLSVAEPAGVGRPVWQLRSQIPERRRAQPFAVRDCVDQPEGHPASRSNRTAREEISVCPRAEPLPTALCLGASGRPLSDRSGNSAQFTAPDLTIRPGTQHHVAHPNEGIPHPVLERVDTMKGA